MISTELTCTLLSAYGGVAVSFRLEQADNSRLLLFEQYARLKMFPNIHRIITLLLLIPVSSATVERGNSAIKRIKSSQRSTMGQDRLNALTLLQIHRDIPLDYKKIVDIFINKNPRRMVSNNPFK